MLWLTYAAAAIFEIAGCFAFWAWLREGRSHWWVAPGIVSLVLFALLLARVPTDAAGRAFAAYGGIYIAASLLWLWLVDGQRPTAWDMLGAAISVTGALIILLGVKNLDA